MSFTRPAGCQYVAPTLLDASGAAVQARARTILPKRSLSLKLAQAQIGVNDTLLAMMFQCTVSCPQLYTASKYTDSLHFIAQVPAGGYASYTLSFDPLHNSSTTHYPVISPVSQVPTISNGHLTLDFSPDTGLLDHVKTSGGSAFAVRQSYWNYIDPQGGAYCLVEQQEAVQLPQVVDAAACTRHSHDHCVCPAAVQCASRMWQRHSLTHLCSPCVPLLSSVPSCLKCGRHGPRARACTSATGCRPHQLQWKSTTLQARCPQTGSLYLGCPQTCARNGACTRTLQDFTSSKRGR